MAVQSVSVSPVLAQVISSAGAKSDVDFDYLVQTAVRESSLNPDARARTSSAVGLFQFIESTWLDVLKSDGPRLGYGDIAAKIQQGEDGELFIGNPADKREILSMRQDPQMSADLAAAFTKRNGEYLAERFGRMPSPGELYIAHFMGARGAERLFEAGLENPDQIAAEIFPRQAAANRSIFFDGDGAKSVREVYRSLVSKHEAEVSGNAGAANPVAANNLGFDQVNGALPSRYGPESQFDFSSLYGRPSEGAAAVAAQPQTVQNQTQSVIVDPGGALFVQLYNR